MMAIGAVAFSMPSAMAGSLYLTLMNGHGLWHCIALYSALGFVFMMMLMLAIAADQPAARS